MTVTIDDAAQSALERLLIATENTEFACRKERPDMHFQITTFTEIPVGPQAVEIQVIERGVWSEHERYGDHPPFRFCCEVTACRQGDGTEDPVDGRREILRVQVNELTLEPFVEQLRKRVKAVPAELCLSEMTERQLKSAMQLGDKACDAVEDFAKTYERISLPDERDNAAWSALSEARSKLHEATELLEDIWSESHGNRQKWLKSGGKANELS